MQKTNIKGFLALFRQRRYAKSICIEEYLQPFMGNS
jgi:hypothetical protein